MAFGMVIDMMSKKFFVSFVDNLLDIDSMSSAICVALGCYEIDLDKHISNMIDALVEEVQSYLDEETATHIDVGEIFCWWFDQERNGFSLTERYTLKIDDDRFYPTDAEDFYDMLTTLKARFATAKNIDYATTK